MQRPSKLRTLILVLGDQLDKRSAAFDGLDSGLGGAGAQGLRGESAQSAS